MNEAQRKRFSDALERVAGDEEMLVTLAAIAWEDGPELLSKVESQIGAGDYAEAARTAHALKGLLSGFERGEPTSSLQPLIIAAREQRAAELEHGFEALQPRLQSLLEEIRELSRVNVN